MSLIHISQLEKKIDDFHLGPIHLTIERGTITALVGNNGSGKSTLLKLIMNLAKADMGNIRVNDILISGEDESWKQYIAYQPQTTIGYDPFTGKALKDLIANWYPQWDDKFFNRVIDMLHVPLNKPFGKLSPGAQQKLSFALTIARNSPILILDEPTAHIDIPSKKVMTDLLVEWMEDGEKAILIASHQVEDIKKLADYLFVLHDGDMIGYFEKGELTEGYVRYWINQTLPYGNIPGAVTHDEQMIVSNDPERTEQYLTTNDIEWINRETVDLEDIITLLLTKKG